MSTASLCKIEPDWRIFPKPIRNDQLTLTAVISVSYLPTSGPFMQTRSQMHSCEVKTHNNYVIINGILILSITVININNQKLKNNQGLLLMYLPSQNSCNISLGG